MEGSDRLIYGKNDIDRIVSIDVDENVAYIYRELENGEIDVTVVDNRFWILSSEKIDDSWVRLDGNLHYKYGKQYLEKRDFNSDRMRYKKRDIFSVYNSVEALMLKDGYTYFMNMKPEDVSILSFDIESYGLLSNPHKEVFMISNTFRKNGKITKKLFSEDDYGGEKEMLLAWVEWVKQVDPSIITGHNIFGYDLPYLKACFDKYNIKMDLGRDGSNIQFAKYTREYRVDGATAWEYRDCNIKGRELIDTMFLSVKYDIGRNFPTWKLKSIIDHLGLVKEDRQFYDASKIKDNWSNPIERDKIKRYGADDSDDALALFDLMIPAFFYTVQSIPRSFQSMINSASGSWINGFLVRSYLQEAHSIPKANPSETIGGGMSYGIPGIYKNVSKWDANSYYPSTILAFGIYPTKKDPNKNYLKMVEFFTKRRFEQKRKYKETGEKIYDDQQAASKIFINSSYGMLAAAGLNFNDYEQAALITRCCRAGLQKSIIWATGKDIDYWWPEYKSSKTAESDFKDFSFIDNKAKVSFSDMKRHDWILVNLDTDSLSFAKKDQTPFTEEELKMVDKELNDIMYCVWGDDGYYDKVLVSRAKNYVLLEKGSDKLKIKGSSLKDSKKEPILRQMLLDLIDSLIYEKGNEVEIYEHYIREACNITDISQWVIKKSITRTLLTNERSNEANIRKAFNGREFQEGDKVFLFNDIDGMTEKITKGEIERYKNGEPKMIPNRIYRLQEDFTGSYDKEHYIKRVYNTLKTLENVLDLKKFTRYDTKKGLNLLKERGLL